MTNLKTKYLQELAPTLARSLGLKNVLAAPRLEKVVVNVGLSAQNRDPKMMEVTQNVLSRITGQKPVATLARKSISNFKIRQGMIVGYRVTMRGRRMEDFVERLVKLALPRVRDFRGLTESSVDAQGNLSIGFSEYIAFPEIRSDEVEKLHGLEVTLVTTARNRERGLIFFRALGFPFRK